jgi:hypothetical protein
MYFLNDPRSWSETSGTPNLWPTGKSAKLKGMTYMTSVLAKVGEAGNRIVVT